MRYTVISWNTIDVNEGNFGDYKAMKAKDVFIRTRECVNKSSTKQITSGKILIPDNGSSLLKAESLRTANVDIVVFDANTTFSKEDIIDMRFCSDPQVAAEIAAHAAKAGATILVETRDGIKNINTGEIVDPVKFIPVDGTRESIHFVD